ncbi:MAG: alpha-L-fucosidase [Candidatus Methylacidiphilales bacterium]|nr:alpha-L-fucosidase [Candidatus Methylacidiphilales bacterium]
MPTDYAAQKERLKWFNQARFGMFIHWGLYSLLGRGEWVRYTESIPTDEYQSLSSKFNPRHFDARSWARLAKEAGMKYMVLTAKHHDGFCLFDSHHTNFTAPRTAAQRDFVAEYITACREEGLGVGLYFSVKDWDFPAYFEGPEKNPQGWKKLVEHLHNQVRELLTNYGQIDILWYDCPDDANFRGGWGDKTKDIWRSEELEIMVRALQPQILTNNRSGLPGDFATPEQEIPNAYYQDGFFESCITMNHSWGFSSNEGEYKTSTRLLEQLTACAARGGNYLLNVGPNPDGQISPQAVDRLLEMGQWLKICGQAIYGTERILPNWWDFCTSGRITTKGDNAYVIMQTWPGDGRMVLAQLGNHVPKAELLGAAGTLTVKRKGRQLIVEGLPHQPPIHPFNVIKLTLDGSPQPQYYY